MEFETTLREVTKLSYKGRFSLYYKPGEVLMRVYYRDGRQHKEYGKTLEEVAANMLVYLKDEARKQVIHSLLIRPD